MKKKKDKHIGSFQADLIVSISDFFKRPTIAETSLRIDAVWSALLLFTHKYFWDYLFSMLKSAFRKGVQRIVY